MAPKLKCPRCKGTGEQELSPALFACYLAIQELDHPTVPQIFDHLKQNLHPSTINRRVVRLLKTGLIISRNGSGLTKYSIKPKKP